LAKRRAITVMEAIVNMDMLVKDYDEYY